MMTNKPVAIIGAGIEGLTAANFLRSQGVPIALFEAGPKIAGLAQSFADKDGFSYDFGAHFVTNRLAAAIGVATQCRDVKYYGESVSLRGRYYGYPFGLMQVPRFLSSALRAKLWCGSRPVTASDHFINAYGEALAKEVALPIIEAWSGAPSHELAASVGSKFSHNIGYTMYLAAMSRYKGVAISSGYCNEIPENPQVWHVYPEGGVATLCQRLADPIRDAVELESPEEKIFVENGHAVAVRVKGMERPVSAVVSTAPCHLLAKIVMGTDALKPLSAFRYRPVVFVNLRMDGRALLPDTVVWTPEEHMPFFRLTETALSMPWLAPDGKTLITCDIGCEVDSDIWKMTDDQLGALCVENLAKLVPDALRRYQGCRVLKTPIAYPVFLNSYEPDRLRLEQSTGVSNLLSVGRNGEFAHILMEDIYWRTRRKMRQLIESLTGQHSLTGNPMAVTI